jgi:RNA polymerase sigma-70 factor (ECF subfamily)
MRAELAIPLKLQETQPAMTQPAEDLDLIHRMQAGDDDAVRDLYALYGQRLYAYALRLTDDPATAEDVTQNTLVTAWRTARTFRAEGRLIAWLLGIVHHTAMKSLRGNTRYLDEVAEETIREDQPTPEEQAQARDESRWVRQGIQSLSPEHRAVLDLVFYQGLSLHEAAQVLNIPVGTVKSRLSYAREHLRGVLARTEER